MPLLSGSQHKSKRIAVHFSLPEDVLDEIKAYCQWSGLQRSPEFIQQAILYVLKNDREWTKFCSNKSAEKENTV
ncbi:MAG: hypothetical protein QM752_00120 [Gammaproteobacteria bacterium]